MNYLLRRIDGSEISKNYDFMLFDDTRQRDYYELFIEEKKYLFEGPCDIVDFENDRTLVVQTWTHIVIFSLLDGAMKYFSGLDESFVGIESLEYDYLVITDLSLFMVNKISFYPWGYKVFTDLIEGYEIMKNYKVDLTFSTEGNLLVKLNRL